MARISKSVAQGIWPTARVGEVAGDVATGLTAAGTTQGTALAITNDTNVFGTVAPSSGAVLFTGEVGDTCIIVNGGANALAVYPASGHSINNLSADAAYSLAAGKGAEFKKVTSTLWVSVGA